MSDLVAFLRARVGEDEAVALAAAKFGAEGIAGRAHWVDRYGMVIDSEDPDWAITDLGVYGAGDDVHAHIARHDPARVLREVEAKWAIIAEYAPVAKNDGLHEPEYAYGWAEGLGTAVRALAAVYRDHPDYDPAWGQ